MNHYFFIGMQRPLLSPAIRILSIEAHEHAMHLHIKITIYVKTSIILFCYHPDRNEQSKIQMELYH
jgi:hypothetical protein